MIKKLTILGWLRKINSEFIDDFVNKMKFRKHRTSYIEIASLKDNRGPRRGKWYQKIIAEYSRISIIYRRVRGMRPVNLRANFCAIWLIIMGYLELSGEKARRLCILFAIYIDRDSSASASHAKQMTLGIFITKRQTASLIS